MASYLLMCR